MCYMWQILTCQLDKDSTDQAGVTNFHDSPIYTWTTRKHEHAVVQGFTHIYDSF